MDEQNLLSRLRHGDEQAVSTASLAPGVYVFQVSTANAQVTRKMVVK